ncbi:MAG: universal stress protein [Gammaproteobacteria bacterium]|nr:universal stress protein [Gammaproteobacteria bacterium]
MKIIVALDFSDITQKVLNHAKKLAQALPADLVLLHVAEPHPDQIAYDFDPASVTAIDPAEIREHIAQRFHQEHKTLQEYADQLRNESLNCTALMVQGETVDMILTEAEKLSADFIMAGSHGKGMISQLLLGSTSEDLLKKSSLPVYLVPANRK